MNILNNYNPMLLCDFYKVSHKNLYPANTEKIYSTFTARTSRIEGVDSIVFFGLQKFIKEYLIDYFNINFFNRPKEEVIEEYSRIIKNTLGISDPETIHIEELHGLGYLPIKITAIREGNLVPIKVPCMTIENTDSRFFWITNFLETLISAEIWQPITSATIAREYRKIVDQYAAETCDDDSHVMFQCHDFSMRGMSSVASAISSGMGHLVSFSGTDTIPAILGLEKYYNGNVEKELLGTSIPATEHSISCAYGKDNELEYYRRIISDIHPSGLVSLVSDTWDLWKVITEYIPSLKENILSRDGKVVIRPDSGNPVDILCGKVQVRRLTYKESSTINSIEDLKKYFYDEAWDYISLKEEDTIDYYVEYENKVYKVTYSAEWTTERGGYTDSKYYVIESLYSNIEEYELTPADKGVIELLWDIFGGTINNKGYKVLDSHIGAIYGDSITLDRCKIICNKLKTKGFASSNITYGVGSFSFQYNTRDTFGFAMKATYAIIDGQEQMLFKDPITDDGTKRSQRGLIFINAADILTFTDGLIREELEGIRGVNALKTVFENGKLHIDDSIANIRDRLKNGGNCYHGA